MLKTTLVKRFTGPNRWIETRGEYLPYAKPDILSATMIWAGQHVDIVSSWLEVRVAETSPEYIYVHFHFEYIQDGIRSSGRWYDKTFSLETLKGITDNTLTYVMTDFVDHSLSEEPIPCVTRIVLRPIVADWIKMLAETRPRPTLSNYIFNSIDRFLIWANTPLCTWSCRCRPSRRSR